MVNNESHQMAIQSRIASWCQPRKAVLHLEQSPKLQFVIFFALVFSCFFQVCLFCLKFEQEVKDRLLTNEGLALAILTFILIGICLILSLSILSGAFWIAAKCLNGKASFPQIRAALLWSFIWFIPSGFFSFLLSYNRVLLPLRLISFFVALFTIIYGYIVMVKTLSEVNRFGFLRAIFSIIGGYAFLGGLVYLAFKFFDLALSVIFLPKAEIFYFNF